MPCFLVFCQIFAGYFSQKGLGDGAEWPPKRRQVAFRRPLLEPKQVLHRGPRCRLFMRAPRSPSFGQPRLGHRKVATTDERSWWAAGRQWGGVIRLQNQVFCWVDQGHFALRMSAPEHENEGPLALTQRTNHPVRQGLPPFPGMAGRSPRFNGQAGV